MTETGGLGPLKYFYRSAAAQQVREEGRKEGFEEARREIRREIWAQNVLMVLERRGLEVPDTVRERVLSSRDLDEVTAWFDRAWEVTRAQDVFGG
ncbi:hypothetical protein [Streptomyces sp. NPDC018693]|uniref:hypothetical protein n=1 Tax=unclassified Streptomyces TaxID=2593676 RepID=UPI003787465F